MNTNLNILSEETLNETKFAELSTVYNSFAKELGLKEIKKFRDKSTGISRILAIQEDYSFEVESLISEKQVKAEKAVKKIKEKVAEEKATLVYKVGKNTPKSENSAKGIMYGLVRDSLELTSEELCERFIESYSEIYKGSNTVDTSFAKGYIAGCVRSGFLELV